MIMNIKEKMEQLQEQRLWTDGSEVKFSGNYITIHNDEKMFHTKFHIEKGNRKLPPTWYIANTGSGTECVADKLGLCDYGLCNGDGSCYSLKAERLYPDSLPCRRNNEIAWDKIVNENFKSEFVYGLLLASKQAKKHKMEVLRFNESGDIKNSKSLRAMDFVAYHLKQVGIPTTVYTHRWDMMKCLLFYNENLVLNGSDFMLDNEFRVVDKFSGENLKCCGDCGICQASGRAYCTQKLGKVIEVIKH